MQLLIPRDGKLVDSIKLYPDSKFKLIGRRLASSGIPIEDLRGSLIRTGRPNPNYHIVYQSCHDEKFYVVTISALPAGVRSNYTWVVEAAKGGPIDIESLVNIAGSILF